MIKLKTSDVCRCILKILTDSDGYALSEDVLADHVNARLRPVPPRATFDEAIVILRGEKYIAAMEGELGDAEAKWLITERGEAWLKKQA